ncbi:16494_t:CDS:2, partial [Funneliformis caledonium]
MQYVSRSNSSYPWNCIFAWLWTASPLLATATYGTAFSHAESRKTGLIDNFWMKRRNFIKYEDMKDEKQSGFKGEISTKDKVLKRIRINEYFPVTLQCEQDQPPQTPPHRIFSCGALSDASTIGQMQNYEVDIENTYLKLSQENSQIVPQKIRKIIEKMKENKSVFDVISLDSTIEDVLEKPYVRPFIHKEHHDLLWIQDIYKRLFLFDAPTNLLLDPDQSELSYWKNFMNPIVVKVFDDIIDLIKVKIGKVENQSNKTQRIETRQYKQRVSIGCSQDRIYSININATILEVGFLEVVGNALYTDIKKLSEDTEKVFKCMQISIHYQCQHYISHGATEQEVSSI